MESKTLNIPAYSEQAFLNCFLQQVFHDARWIPKVQLERIIGPLLTPFIGRLMTKEFQDHNELHGPYKLKRRIWTDHEKRMICAQTRVPNPPPR